MFIPELRPTEVLEAYWEEVVNLELGSEFLDPIYLEVA